MNCLRHGLLSWMSCLYMFDVQTHVYSTGRYANIDRVDAFLCQAEQGWLPA